MSKRELLVEVECGETTCQSEGSLGCRRLRTDWVGGLVCAEFGKPISSEWSRTAKRLPECLEAERSANQGPADDSMVRQNEALKAALRPFAAYYHPSQKRLDGRLVSRRTMPDEAGFEDGAEVGLTAADFETAAAALGPSNTLTSADEEAERLAQAGYGE